MTISWHGHNGKICSCTVCCHWGNIALFSGMTYITVQTIATYTIGLYSYQLISGHFKINPQLEPKYSEEARHVSVSFSTGLDCIRTWFYYPITIPSQQLGDSVTIVTLLLLCSQDCTRAGKGEEISLIEFQGRGSRMGNIFSQVATSYTLQLKLWMGGYVGINSHCNCSRVLSSPGILMKLWKSEL